MKICSGGERPRSGSHCSQGLVGYCWLFPYHAATPQGVQRSLPKRAASGWVLAAWGSIQDPHPGVPGAVGVFSLLFVFVSRLWGVAGAEARLERLQGHGN